jgi:hypothetical protein
MPLLSSSSPSPMLLRPFLRKVSSFLPSMNVHVLRFPGFTWDSAVRSGSNKT